MPTAEDIWAYEIKGVDGNGAPVEWSAGTWLHYISAQASRENAELAAQIAALQTEIDAIKAQLAQPSAPIAIGSVAISQDIPAVLHIGGQQ